MTSLRIIKRNDKYVVQIGIERKILFYNRKTKWIDLEDRLKWLQRGRITRGYQPIDQTEYDDLKSADEFCKVYIRSERKDIQNVVKTYNTNLNDIVWSNAPEMPKYKELKKTCVTCLDPTCPFRNDPDGDGAMCNYYKDKN